MYWVESNMQDVSQNPSFKKKGRLEKCLKL